MKRTLTEFLSWLSLALLIALTAVGVRSWFLVDEWRTWDVAEGGPPFLLRMHHLQIARASIAYSLHSTALNRTELDGSVSRLSPETFAQRSELGDARAIVDKSNFLGFAFVRKTSPNSRSGLQTRTAACIPFWPAAALCVLAPAAAFGGVLRKRRKAERGLCRACGYDLRASPERCPECGTPLTKPRSSLAVVVMRRLPALIAAVIVLAIVPMILRDQLGKMERRRDVAWQQAGASLDLLAAMEHNNADGMCNALKAGADPNVWKWIPSGSVAMRTDPPLCYAMARRWTPVVQQLIISGADVNARGTGLFDRDAPLHLALRNRDWVTARLLIKAGADVTARDGFGNAPRALFGEWESPELARLLTPPDAHRAPQTAKDK